MARGKGTNLHLYCTTCTETKKAPTVYTTRYNEAKAATAGKPTVLEKKKFCKVCRTHQMHKSKRIKKGGTKALLNAK